MNLFGNDAEQLERRVDDILAGSKHAGVSSAVLHCGIFSPEESSQLFTELYQGVSWQQHEIRVYGKLHRQPRLDAWFGDEGVVYSYSGLRLQASGWIDPILRIKTCCEGIAQRQFNSVLLNLYRDGNDAMGWHSDNEPELGSEPVIASVSLGAVRRFDLRHRQTGETRRVPLPAGSMLIMGGRLQEEWVHQVARTKKVNEPRINLTFRHVRCYQ